ncbi:MAG: LEA type 2 family protein [Burkholderiales bacterium]|nr:LEA type 2 family protein [Burkholderiales bacterium]
MHGVGRGIAAGMLLALSACAGMPGGMEPLSVTLADVRPSQMGLLEQEYMMKLRVQNPNGIDVPLQGVAFSVELNGKTFAKGVSRQNEVVPAFGDVLLEVKAISSLGDVLNQVSGLRAGAPERITYRVQGKLARTHGTSVPFDSTGNVDLSALAGEAPR